MHNFTILCTPQSAIYNETISFSLALHTFKFKRFWLAWFMTEYSIRVSWKYGKFFTSGKLMKYHSVGLTDQCIDADQNIWNFVWNCGRAVDFFIHYYLLFQYFVCRFDSSVLHINKNHLSSYIGLSWWSSQIQRKVRQFPSLSLWKDKLLIFLDIFYIYRIMFS